MKNNFKIIGTLILILIFPMQASMMTFNFDRMIIAEPVILSNNFNTTDTIPSQPLKKIQLQNSVLDLEPLVQLQQDFKLLDVKLMSPYELQIYNDLEKQLDSALRPKTFVVDEKTVEQSLSQYRVDRVALIKNENAGNIAEINDQLGVLDDEITSFSFTLREQLQMRAVSLEKEQENLILNLQLSLTDFKTFYHEKEKDSTVRSGSLTKSPVVTTMSTKLTAASDTYNDVKEKQNSLLAAINASKTEVSGDSLKATYLINMENQLLNDQQMINEKFANLQEQRQKIVTLSEDIKFLSEPLDLTMSSDDKLILNEQASLLQEKELELQKELEIYYQMQTETQLILNTSLNNLSNFTLK